MNHHTMKTLFVKKKNFTSSVERYTEGKTFGVLWTSGGEDQTVQEIFETQNVARSPILFSMDPKEELMVFQEMENQSMEIIAICYSHIHTIPFPSEADLEMAFPFDVPLIIISLKEKDDSVVKAFRIRKEAIYLEEIEVI